MSAFEAAKVIFSLADLSFGVLYMFFGRGPRIEGVPPLIMALCRFSAPFFMYPLALFQAAASPKTS